MISRYSIASCGSYDARFGNGRYDDDLTLTVQCGKWLSALPPVHPPTVFTHGAHPMRPIEQMGICSIKHLLKKERQEFVT